METSKAKVQDVINEIYQRDGEVKPSTLLEEARSESSPIHNAFEWDNTKAGHEFRLIQARTWIRKVRIIIEDRVERLVHVPRIVFEDVDYQDSNEGYYKPISIVVQEQDEFKAALNSAKASLNSARSAYEDLKRAARESKPASLPDFKRADRGFGMVESALSLNG